MRQLDNGNYEIRNKTTGELKVVRPEDLPKYGISAPEQPKEYSLEGLLGNAGQDVMGSVEGAYQSIPKVIDPLNPKLYKDPVGHIVDQSFQPLNQLMGTVQGAGEVVSNPVDFAYENPVTTLLTLLGAAKGGGKITKTVKETGSIKPKKIVGSKLETKVQGAGNAPVSLIEQFLNENVLKGATTGENAGAMARKLAKEKSGLNIGAGGAAGEGVPFTKIKDFRESAGQRGYGTTGADTRYYKNLQKAYSDILKEGAGTEGLDKMYSLLSKVEGGTRKTTKALPYIAGSALIYGLLNKLGL